MWIFTKKSFHYQLAEFCCHDKFWVEALAWRKIGCNKLTKMSCKFRFYYILLMNTFSKKSFCCEIFYLIELYVLEYRGVATGGLVWTFFGPNSELNKVQQFPFQTSGILLLTGVQKLCDQKFHDFYHLCYNFRIIYGGYLFFLTTYRKQIISRWTLWEGLILNAGPSEMFPIVDHPKGKHNEWKFQR